MHIFNNLLLLKIYPSILFNCLQMYVTNKRMLAKRRSKDSKHKWMDWEVEKIIDFLQAEPVFEAPSAQVFYNRFLAGTTIDATWDMVKGKVRHLRDVYRRAKQFLNSTGAEVLNEHGSKTEAKLARMCPHFERLHEIFGERRPFKFQPPPMTTDEPPDIKPYDLIICDQSKFQESLNIGIPTYLPPLPPAVPLSSSRSVATSPTNSVPPSSPTNAAYNNTPSDAPSTAIPTSTKKYGFNNIANANAQLSGIEKDRLKLEREKFESERALEEKKIEVEVKRLKREAEMDEKRYSIEERRFEMDYKIEERKIQIEERRLELEFKKAEDEAQLKRLELEMKERIAKYEIEQKFKQ